MTAVVEKKRSVLYLFNLKTMNCYEECTEQQSEKCGKGYRRTVDKDRKTQNFNINPIN